MSRSPRGRFWKVAGPKTFGTKLEAWIPHVPMPVDMRPKPKQARKRLTGDKHWLTKYSDNLVAKVSKQYEQWGRLSGKLAPKALARQFGYSYSGFLQAVKAGTLPPRAIQLYRRWLKVNSIGSPKALSRRHMIAYSSLNKLVRGSREVQHEYVRSERPDRSEQSNTGKAAYREAGEAEDWGEPDIPECRVH